MPAKKSSRLVLVTGGAGYFGATLIDALRVRGDTIRVLDIASDPSLPVEVDYIRGDIRDREAVARACREVAAVHHCVAHVPLARDRALFDSVNVHGTRVLLDEARRAGVGKVVHVSSSAVFGVPERNPVTATRLRIRAKRTAARSSRPSRSALARSPAGSM